MEWGFSEEREYAEEAWRMIETSFRSLFEAMSEGVAIHEMQFDDCGKPVEYRIIDVNPTFEKHTGIQACQARGALSCALYGVDRPPFLDVYASVVQSGQPRKFETFFPPLQRYFQITAFSPGKNLFATVFEDITRGKKAEGELRESVERYRGLFESSNDAIFIHDNRGNFLDVNARGCEMIGYSREQILSLVTTALHPEGEVESAIEAVRTMESQGAVRFESQFIRSDGKIIDVEISTSPVAGATDINQAIVRDITERKRTERQLRYQAALLENVNDAIVASDANFILTAWNSAAEKMYGWKAEEVLGRNGLEIVQTEFPEADKRKMLDIIAVSGAWRGEVTQARKDGARFPVETASIAVRDRNGRVSGYVSVNRDITERRKVEDVLRASEEKYRYLFESMTEGMVLLEMINDDSGVAVDYRYLDVNSAYESIIDAKRSERVGRTASEIYGETVFLDTFSQVASTGEPVSFEAYIHFLKKHLMISAFSVERGKVAVVFTDITDRTLAEAAIRLNDARLESLLRISQHHTARIEDLLDLALDEATVLTGSKVGYIYRYSEQSHQFELNSWSRSVMEVCSILEKQTVYDLEKTGIWGEAVRQRRPIIVNDFLAPDPLKKGYPEGHAPLFRFMTIPVFSGDAIVAVVGVANKETDYDSADVRQLTLMMDTVWNFVERKQIDLSLQESEDRYRRLFDSGNDAVFVHSFRENGMPENFIEVNAIACKRYGFSREEFLKLSPGDIDDPACAAAVMPAILQELMEKKHILFEMVHRAKDGRLIPCEVNAHLFDLRGKPTVLSVARDIAERKRAQEALRESRELLAKAEEIAHIGSWKLEPATGQLTWSDESYRLFGFQPQEFAASYEAFLEAVHPDDRAAVDAAYSSSLRECRDSYEIEHRLVRHNTGEIRHVHEKCRHVCDSSGKIVRSVGMVQDITERKELQEKIDRLRRENEAFMRHEFKNLLIPMRGYSELLLLIDSDNLTTKQRNYLNIIKENADRAVHVVDYLKKLQDIEAGSYSLECTPVSIGDLVEDVLRNVTPEADRYGVSLLLNRMEKISDMNADMNLMPGVFSNLVMNAIEHVASDPNPADRIVAIELFNRERKICTRIQNGGKPVPPEKLSTFFEKFNSDRKRKQNGTGLGTTYAWLVTRAHGGDIRVESNAREGTTVMVSFDTISPVQ